MNFTLTNHSILRCKERNIPYPYAVKVKKVSQNIAKKIKSNIKPGRIKNIKYFVSKCILPHNILYICKDLGEDKRTFEIFGTGHSMPENFKRKYIGTYQVMGGGLVFHCFELLGVSKNNAK